MIIFAKICKSKYYKDFILLFVHPATFWQIQSYRTNSLQPMLFQRSLTAYRDYIFVNSPVFRTEFSRQANPPSVLHSIHIDLQPLKKPFFAVPLENNAIFTNFA